MAETYTAGYVTAYGAAVRGGYTRTYEEFCAEQAKFAENAAAVAQAKEDVASMQGQVEQAAATFTGTTVPAAVATVQEAGAAQVQAVQSEGTMQAAAVETVGAQQTAAVGAAGSDAVDAVEAAETAATGAVTAAQTAAVQAVQTESTTQQAAIQTKGQETIASIPADYTALSNEVDDLKSSINTIEDVVFAQAEGITKTNGRYINRSGVQGTTTWCNLYKYTPKNGEVVLIDTYAPLNAVPGFYYNGVAYPASPQSAGEYSGSLVGDGTSILYVNSAVNDGAEVKVPDILVDAHAKTEEIKEVSATVNTLQAIGIKERTSVEVPGYENRYITAAGVQGSLSGYTMKVLTTEPNAVYLIYSEIGTNVAAGGLPIVLFNGVNYTNTTGKGYYIIIGDGEKAYINSLTTANVITDKYVFTSNMKAVPNVFRMFDNVVCCGDSLTYSQVWLSSNSQRQALVTYPEALAKITGTDTETLAVPGYTCKQWWDAFNAQITGANKLYLIYLGTNEPDSNLPNTADTDCAGDDLTQYATNGTGYYGRIIRKILDTGSRCILIKIALGTTGNNKNASISGLATRFSVPVINNPQFVLNDMFYHYGDTTDYYNTIHLNDAGYEAFAELVVDRVNNLTLEEKYALMPRTAT